MLLPVLNYSFFVCQTFHWILGITIACHCDLFFMPASFGSGNVASASFPINSINKGRWSQEEHKIFMQEYEKYGIIARKMQEFSALEHLLISKSMLDVSSNKF